ncbi:hypothetical protein [Vibrio phage ICP3]|uniref:Uncharacterized protein orf51 n=1 Tax=Vibrio phage ICP3 TaxID=979535 RepID=F1D047_9CAUD|nr:hypothetical protein ViPhICP3_gp51 [Vibrio phage ICP3]ADX87491.1 hypothetical protein [Vibrio phage ICP3]
MVQKETFRSGYCNCCSCSTWCISRCRFIWS